MSNHSKHQLLNRAVDTILPSPTAFEQALTAAEAEGRRLRVYWGIDPTAAHLHIGHTIPLRKLAQVQQAGHQAILLIGDFTGRLGDPTDKMATRVPLTKEQVAANMASYLEQAGKILDLKSPTNPVEIRYNSEWSDSMTFEQVVKLAAHFTVQQMLERDMFRKRLEAQKPVSLSEFFYPLMQGYDAVALKADAQIGGTDQTFNMLAGRTLNKVLDNREMYVVVTPLLGDKEGVKIGKTQGNAINIDEEPHDFYGQIMSLPDVLIGPGFELLTDVEDGQLSDMAQALSAGQNPMTYKKLLAHTLTTMYHGPAAADSAQAHIEQTLQAGAAPE
jgi:tyrosyl-tRNA synthetase